MASWTRASSPARRRTRSSTRSPSATAATRTARRLREFVGNVFKESIDYIGLPAEAVKAQLQAGKSLGQIAGQQPGKSRDGLVADLHGKAEARIKAAVDAGKLTPDQAQQLRTKVDEAIVKIVDHEGAPRRDKAAPKAPAATQ